MKIFKIFLQTAVFLLIYYLLILLFWYSITVTPRLLRFVEAPFHETSHVVAIKIVEAVSQKEIVISKVVFLNVNISSPEKFYYSFLLAYLGVSPLGYVFLTEDEISKFSWEEKFWIGLAGGAGGLIFILCFWCLAGRSYYYFFGKKDLSVLFSLVLIHIPFLITSIDIILYACDEAGKLGFI